MRARFVNETAGTKDIARIESIINKSKGDPDKEVMYATNMAKAITTPGKAKARAEAAQEVYGELNDVAEIFFDRATELAGGGEVESAPSKMPGEKTDYSQWESPALQRAATGFSRGRNPYKKLGLGQYSTAVKINRSDPVHHGRSYSHGGQAIASLGNVNLMTGECKWFNLFESWEGNDTTVEVWRTVRGKIKLIFTSSSEPLASINDTASFQGDQSGNHLFDAKMLDYTLLKDMPGLIPYYGTTLAGYTYK